jgi:hypothetical protein
MRSWRVALTRVHDGGLRRGIEEKRSRDDVDLRNWKLMKKLVVTALIIGHHCSRHQF